MAVDGAEKRMADLLVALLAGDMVTEVLEGVGSQTAEDEMECVVVEVTKQPLPAGEEVTTPSSTEAAAIQQNLLVEEEAVQPIEGR